MGDGRLPTVLRRSGFWSARRELTVSMLLLVAALNAGCGGSDPLGRRAVSGTVTLDGVPVKQGRIDFQPLQQGGVPSGATISDGKYAIPEEKGLPVGKYRVTINAADTGAVGGLGSDGLPGDVAPVPKELIPAKYNTETTLTAEVGDKEPYEFNYDLKSK